MYAVAMPNSKRAAPEGASSRKQLTHERIVDTAARALRSSGFHGVGVADVMKQAGLTHGGFYAHFPSRDVLLAEALQRAGDHSREHLRNTIASARAQGLSSFHALVEGYLSERHLKSPEGGCPVSALASEMPRQTGAVRDAAAARVKSLIASVQETLPAGVPEGTAGAIAGQLVGSLQLARALGDNAQGRRHLAAARRFLLEQFDASAPSRA
jgi:TetR/AcrR family transcriptional regulator, transcriptional repressor for nem operon